ncbi:hypothetical protein [Streptomyces sporangiiformans]|uniref:Tn3 transposase DDE domain-containing protein n=1 Tax=Streptomyces sporangiiformans TaxID=2315329 RepID=A0A505DR27_9ACTN|nr:hypothetical protein [Streptomyces sporangiiformans]TPQ23751.1 hypothetical protein FGD71_002495 [Streptomyces sporangiiformans]
MPSATGGLPVPGTTRCRACAGAGRSRPQSIRKQAAAKNRPADLISSPYRTEHINRFGEYSTHEFGIQPEAYGPKPGVDFTPLTEQDLTTVGFGRAV